MGSSPLTDSGQTRIWTCRNVVFFYLKKEFSSREVEKSSSNYSNLDHQCHHKSIQDHTLERNTAHTSTSSIMASDGMALPPFPADHAIELVSVKDSKIISVSVYSGRAEITRLFKFTVKSGLNQVLVQGLPRVLDKDSFR